MELFSVRRYDEGNAPEQKEAEILQNLLKKVEKRKRKKHVEKEEKAEKRNKLDARKEENEERVVIAIEEQQEEYLNNDVADGEVAEDKDNDKSKEDSGFAVLGDDADFKKRQKVAMVLPPWLAHPTIVSMNLSKDSVEADAITDLAYLTSATRTALKELAITRLFPVQKAVIPWILNAHNKPPPFRPRDICVSAPTGSGKTLGFAIPVVQVLTKRVQPKIRALVVLPVIELALQVFKVFKKLCEKTDLTVCLLSKQIPFGVEQQKLVGMHQGQSYSKVDIVVTTPGRLVDHLHSTKGFCLNSLKFLIIDEADRIMDAMFQNWIYHLDEHVRNTTDQLLLGRTAPLCYHELIHTANRQPHKLLFSATLSQDPEKLQNLRLFHPKLFTSVMTNIEELHEKFSGLKTQTQEVSKGEFIGKYTTPAELTEKYCITESRVKPLTLYALIKENGWSKCLCFTNSNESAGRLAFVLSEMMPDEYNFCELSATLDAKDRTTVLNRFARGQINGLICSDALARGIDIPNVDIVISYDTPRHVKTYIHRIGRTARAGESGTAITLLTQRELQNFNQALAQVSKRLVNEIKVSTTMEEQYAAPYSHALGELRRKLERDKRKKLIMKERAKESNIVLSNKAPEDMTLMEKLQVQVHNKTIEKVQNSIISKQQEKPIFVPNRKKFNASAGKNKTIDK